MNAALKLDTRPVPAIDVFRERCEARAILVEACALDLHTAVDELQAAAKASGLIDDIGQDAVQAMMAEAFTIPPKLADRPANEVTPASEPIRKPVVASAGELQRDYEAALRKRDLPTSTLQAAEYLLHQNNAARFKAWLAKHSPAERCAITKHIQGKAA